MMMRNYLQLNSQVSESTTLMLLWCIICLLWCIHIGNLDQNFKIEYEGFEDQPDVASVHKCPSTQDMTFNFLVKTSSPCDTEGCGNVLKFTSEREQHWFDVSQMIIYHARNEVHITGDFIQGVTRTPSEYVFNKCVVDNAVLKAVMADTESNSMNYVQVSL